MKTLKQQRKHKKGAGKRSKHSRRKNRKWQTKQWCCLNFTDSLLSGKCSHSSLFSLSHLGHRWSLISIRTFQNSALTAINWIQIAGVKCTAVTTFTSQSIQFIEKPLLGGCQWTQIIIVCSHLSCFIASFYGDGYIHLRTVEASVQTLLHVRFRTSTQTGLLFLASGRRDFLLLELISGHMQVKTKAQDNWEGLAGISCSHRWKASRQIWSRERQGRF